MRRMHWMLIAVVGLALIAPAFAGGDGCRANAQACLDKMASQLQAHGWAGLELDKDDYGALSVTRVVADSPAEAAGFKAGDVIVALNGIEFSEGNYDAIKKAKTKMAPGKQVTYTIARKGKNRDVSVTLAKVPQDVLARWIGGHMLEGHTKIASASQY